MLQTDTWADIPLYPYRFSSMGVSGGWTGTMGDIQISDKRVVMSQPGYDYGRSKGEGLGTESEIIWGWMRSSLPPQDKQLNTKWEITLEMSEGTRWLLDLERCPCWVYRLLLISIQEWTGCGHHGRDSGHARTSGGVFYTAQTAQTSQTSQTAQTPICLLWRTLVLIRDQETSSISRFALKHLFLVRKKGGKYILIFKTPCKCKVSKQYSVDVTKPIEDAFLFINHLFVICSVVLCRHVQKTIN